MEKQKWDKHNPNEKSDALQPDERHSEMRGYINYCVPGIMSRCRAGAVWSEQKKCKYYQKSTTRDECMHYIKALNGHCDCVRAQREKRNQHDRQDDEV